VLSGAAAIVTESGADGVGVEFPTSVGSDATFAGTFLPFIAPPAFRLAKSAFQGVVGMKSAAQSLVQDQPNSERAENESGFFSSDSVLDILKLILAGAELSEVLTIIAELVESRGNGALCTIWLPDAGGKHLNCAAAPSLPGFAANVGPMSIGPKGGSCGTAVYRREPVYVADIFRESIT
jgi:hypothetical protein